MSARCILRRGDAARTLTTQKPAYVEPLLFSSETEQLSIIVTAADSLSAARAVERIGGQVTSDLWLIDAVAALIPRPACTPGGPT